MNIVSKLGALTLVGLTAACGPMQQGGLGAKAVERVGILTGLREAPPAAPPVVPTEALEQGPGNVLMVTLLGRNAVAALTRVGSNNGVETWRTAKGVTLSFRDGILVASRGLSQDLMGADVGDLAQVIREGQGSARRTHSFLDSEDQIIIRDMTCVISSDGPETITTVAGTVETIKVVEDCTGAALVFQNSYWLDEPGGVIVQSRQALAPSVGFIKVNPL